MSHVSATGCRLSGAVKRATLTHTKLWSIHVVLDADDVDALLDIWIDALGDVKSGEFEQYRSAVSAAARPGQSSYLKGCLSDAQLARIGLDGTQQLIRNATSSVSSTTNRVLKIP